MGRKKDKKGDGLKGKEIVKKNQSSKMGHQCMVLAHCLMYVLVMLSSRARTENITVNRLCVRLPPLSRNIRWEAFPARINEFNTTPCVLIQSVDEYQPETSVVFKRRKVCFSVAVQFKELQ